MSRNSTRDYIDDVTTLLVHPILETVWQNNWPSEHGYHAQCEPSDRKHAGRI
jgi:hypothetical protein